MNTTTNDINNSEKSLFSFIQGLFVYVVGICLCMGWLSGEIFFGKIRTGANMGSLKTSTESRSVSNIPKTWWKYLLLVIQIHTRLLKSQEVYIVLQAIALLLWDKECNFSHGKPSSLLRCDCSPPWTIQYWKG